MYSSPHVWKIVKKGTISPPKSSFRSRGGKLRERIATSITISRKLTQGWCQSHMFGKPPGILPSQFGINPRRWDTEDTHKEDTKDKASHTSKISMYSSLQIFFIRRINNMVISSVYLKIFS
ncbi:hypothetical protein CDAR_283861 [Caerostris darwini]|uniref:Uncharacterized protein n=1 Tax=Caerostris darwini TaxID=1538125 RepID=A0AAV4NE95_9ARAC|nr:hypothetical protein CDAR_283861 [Caerostris darwini]